MRKSQKIAAMETTIGLPKLRADGLKGIVG